jgi:hypothetical protein
MALTPFILLCDMISLDIAPQGTHDILSPHQQPTRLHIAIVFDRRIAFFDVDVYFFSLSFPCSRLWAFALSNGLSEMALGRLHLLSCW